MGLSFTKADSIIAVSRLYKLASRIQTRQTLHPDPVDSIEDNQSLFKEMKKVINHKFDQTSFHW